MNTGDYCTFRLPCGVCTRMNSICPLLGQTITPADPPMVAVYAAPAYPYNYGVTTTTLCTDAGGKETEDGEIH